MQAEGAAEGGETGAGVCVCVCLGGSGCRLDTRTKVLRVAREGLPVVKGRVRGGGHQQSPRSSVTRRDMRSCEKGSAGGGVHPGNRSKSFSRSQSSPRN